MYLYQINFHISHIVLQFSSRYDLRKHIKNFHSGHEIKIVKLDPNLHPPHTFKPSRTGIPFTINLRDWKELLHGTAPPGRKDTDTIVITEQEYMNMTGIVPIPVKQEPIDYYEDSMSQSDLRSVRSDENEDANNSLCFNCCYCPFSTRDTAIYAAHLQTHSSRGLVTMNVNFEYDNSSVPGPSYEPQFQKIPIENMAELIAKAQTNQPVVKMNDIMELEPLALEGLLHSNGVTSIRF